ncbi:hypothetical protein ACS0TY_034073 [Phlomoides rotata]
MVGGLSVLNAVVGAYNIVGGPNSNDYGTNRILRCFPTIICAQVVANGAMKSEGLKRGLQSMESCDYQMSESSDSGDIDEDTAKELEHTYLQNSLIG